MCTLTVEGGAGASVVGSSTTTGGGVVSSLGIAVVREGLFFREAHRKNNALPTQKTAKKRRQLITDRITDFWTFFEELSPRRYIKFEKSYVHTLTRVKLEKFP